MSETPLIRHLGLVPYEPTWRAMQRFTDERDATSRDEIWFLEHPPVFTLGLNARREHLRQTGDIPVVQIDRGGQVTYHGPGQLVIYPLLDLKRRSLGVRELVVALENSVIDYARELGIAARGSREAPGVYVGDAKLASIGLRVRRGSSYHGMAFNVCLDPEPFRRIDVCGHPGLAVTRLADLCGVRAVDAAAAGLIPHLLRRLENDAAGRCTAEGAAQSAINTSLQAVSSR
ncbi:MAG TPA: lipoyl(octanoyl) transferase LipB [Steroidobacteraceae bacterium]|jgi:lipoyl(octanoyl) transferase|nr:lipoyl(octanoyl) transferase LipB [Steroidobacteraceae bacterium]